MGKSLIVIGGGEHARVVLEAAVKTGWHILGYIDPKNNVTTESQYKIKRLGDDSDLINILDKDKDSNVISGLGGDSAKRERILSSFNLPPERWATIVHPSAVISPNSAIGHGTVVLGRAVIQPGVKVGAQCILNSGTIIEHDSVVGDYTHVAPGVVTGGKVGIGKGCFIGLGSRIRDHISIGDNVTVGVGSVVLTDIPAGETVVGVPARRITKKKMEIDVIDLCIPLDSTIFESLSVIGKYGTMIALVTDSNHKLLGLVSDGDIRRALLKNKNLNESISTVMNRNFSFVYHDVPRAVALDLMKAKAVRQMPVLDFEGRVVGLHLFTEIIGSLNLPNIVVIMAGGKGTRLRPITEAIPKPMVRVAGRPILEHIILHLASSNLREIFLAVNYKSEIIEHHFGDGSAYGCRIQYLREEIPLGTAGALGLLPVRPTEPFIVMNGDLVTQFDVERLLHHHAEGNYAITIGVHNYRVDIPYGVIGLNDDGTEVTELIEKPSRHFLVNGGIYVVNPELLDLIRPSEEITMVMFIERALSSKKKVGIHLVEGDWIDVGEHKELAAARGFDQ